MIISPTSHLRGANYAMADIHYLLPAEGVSISACGQDREECLAQNMNQIYRQDYHVEHNGCTCVLKCLCKF